MDSNNQIIIYQTEDGQTQVDVRLENETVWLTQKQIAEITKEEPFHATYENAMEAINGLRYYLYHR